MGVPGARVADGVGRAARQWRVCRHVEETRQKQRRRNARARRVTSVVAGARHKAGGNHLEARGCFCHRDARLAFVGNFRLTRT